VSTVFHVDACSAAQPAKVNAASSPRLRIGREALARQEALSGSIRTTAWKTQLRLTQRFAALRNRGVQINKACVAVARELAGFIWAIGLQAQREKAQAS